MRFAGASTLRKRQSSSPDSTKGGLVPWLDIVRTQSLGSIVLTLDCYPTEDIVVDNLLPQSLDSDSLLGLVVAAISACLLEERHIGS